MITAPDLRTVIISCIHAALRAPSSHNCQPWLFVVVNDEYIEVWGNKSRQLPLSDTNNRQFYESIGCAIQHIVITADYYRYAAQVDLFPTASDMFHVATISFKLLADAPQAESSHLFFSIPLRHSNREPYDRTPVPEALIDSIRQCATDDMRIDIVSDDRRRHLSQIAMDATATAFADRGFCDELSRWMRPSLKKYKDGMPGYNIGVPWLISFLIPFALRHFNLINQQVAMVKTMLDHTETFLIISTASDDPETWVRVGMTWERIALMVTASGVRIGMLAAPIQIGEHYREIQNVLQSSYRPQTFSRIGFTRRVPVASPRLSFDDVVRFSQRNVVE
ncbi:MAG: hypothetical protein RIQ54_451 [Candidatus Parcubacteria bacterium]|jgi:hypothetical protein